MRDKAAIKAKCEEIRDDIAAGFLELDISDSELGEYIHAVAERLRELDSIQWALAAEMEDSDFPA